MSEAEIATVIQAYADAAANAQSIGFDGIELHGAHGFLIDQFFWKTTNRRTDRYGGNLYRNELNSRLNCNGSLCCGRS